jgi:hypothetical protein
MSKSKERVSLDASEARMLLSHPLLRGALNKIKDNVVLAIEENPMTDGVMRDKLMLTLQVRRQFIEELTRYLEDAEIMDQSQSEEI